jgi:hypothetical protein
VQTEHAKQFVTTSNGTHLLGLGVEELRARFIVWPIIVLAEQAFESLMQNFTFWDAPVATKPRVNLGKRAHTTYTAATHRRIRFA